MATGAQRAPRNRRSWSQRLGISTLVVLTICMTVAATVMGYVAHENDLVHRKNLALAKLASGKPANFLIVGSDSRADVAKDDPNKKAFGSADGQRSDSIMVARIDPHTQRISLLSLPRDLWVPIAGHHETERINSAFGMGTQTLINTVEQTFNIPINHYIEVDFAGFEGLVKAVDGVPMYFDTPMRDQHSGLMINVAGCTVLDGSQGLAFARSRYLQYRDTRGRWVYDGTGDLGRIARQQYFIRKAMKRAVGKAESDPFAIKSLIDVGVKNVTIDSNLSTGDLINLATRFSSFDSNNMETYSVPVTPFVTAGGADVLSLNADASQPVLDLFRDPLPPVTESNVKVRVLNGSNTPGIEGNVAGALQQAGFGLSQWGEGSEVDMPLVDHTQLLYGSGGLAGAKLVARHLPIAVTVTMSPKLADGEVVLVVTTDLKSVDATARPANTPPPSTTPSTSGSGSTTTSSAPPTTAPQANVKGPGIRLPGQPPPGVSCG